MIKTREKNNKDMIFSFTSYLTHFQCNVYTGVQYICFSFTPLDGSLNHPELLDTGTNFKVTYWSCLEA